MGSLNSGVAASSSARTSKFSGLGVGAAEPRVLARMTLRATMRARLLKAIIFCNGVEDLVRVSATDGRLFPPTFEVALKLGTG